MKRIFILGAGRSSTTLIEYLIEESKKNDWQIIIGEKEPETALNKFPNAQVISFDILDATDARAKLIDAHLVISMLPASLHIHVALICANFGISMLTASYV